MKELNIHLLQYFQERVENSKPTFIVCNIFPVKERKYFEN